MPVAFAIGISGALFFVQHPELPFTIPIQLTVSQTQNFALLAVPLFIMAGNFMNKSGITEQLLQLATVIAGRLRGGLAQVSWRWPPDGRRLGLVHRRRRHADPHAGPEMLKRGFAKGYAAGVLSFGSLMTPIIPPGIGFILYGTVGQVSIGRLFAAGILPGLHAVGRRWPSRSRSRRGGAAIAPERQDAAVARARSRAAPGAASGRSCFRSSCSSGLRFGIFTPVGDRRVRGRLRGARRRRSPTAS